MTVRFFFSVTGVERVWDGSRWRKVRAGHHLTTYLGPYLRALEDLVGYEKETDITYYESGKEAKKKEFLRQIDSLLPSPPFYNVVDKNAFLEALLGGFLSLWTYNSRYYTARQALEEWERKQLLAMRPLRGRVHPVLPYLQGSWCKCDIWPDIEVGKKTTRLGWVIKAPAPWDAAACELVLMVMHNACLLRLCPKCLTFHWERNHHLCRECRREKERKKKASKKKAKTQEGRFLNLLSQDKSRKKLNADQVEEIKGVLRKQGLKAAIAERQRLREKASGHH